MRRHRQTERVELGAPRREPAGRVREVLVVHEGPVVQVTRELLDPGTAATTPPEIDPAAVPGPARCPLCQQPCEVMTFRGEQVFSCACVGQYGAVAIAAPRRRKAS